MKELTGIRISQLGFQPQKLGDLIYYEGPLLSLFIDDENPDIYYLYKWVDNDKTVNRWIVVQINSAILRNFFHKRISLRNLIVTHPVTFSVEMNNGLAEQNIQVCATAELPEEYLPAENSFYDEEAFTEFAEAFKTIINSITLYDKLNKEMSEIKSIIKARTISVS